MRVPEIISDRLIQLTLGMCPGARTVTSVVEYVPTDTQAVREKHAFWTDLDRVIKEVPGHEQWFVLLDANARTGRKAGRRFGSKECKVLRFYGRDTFNDNGERVLSFSADHGLALLDTLFFNTIKNAISHNTFNGRDKQRIDYTLTKQRDRSHVGDFAVHLQPAFL